MKYQYFYQTSKNENRDGFVNAKNRAEAYALLRKQGIRPYRLLGDDPVNWQPWAVGAAFFLLVSAFVGYVFWGPQNEVLAVEAVRRQQLYGDKDILLKGLETSWKDVLPTNLDCYLAAYAQPGWIALPPDFTPEEKAHFKDDLSVQIVLDPGDPEIVALLKRIIISMRQEMKAYLDKGGDIDGYLTLLEERQDREIEARRKARETVRAAEKDKRHQVLMNQNYLLSEQGIAELELDEVKSPED